MTSDVHARAMPTTAPSPGADNPVPPLVACVMPDGTAAVFPGTRASCVTLGLPDATSLADRRQGAGPAQRVQLSHKQTRRPDTQPLVV
jgi:hypothetical protein